MVKVAGNGVRFRKFTEIFSSLLHLAENDQKLAIEKRLTVFDRLTPAEKG